MTWLRNRWALIAIGLMIASLYGMTYDRPSELLPAQMRGFAVSPPRAIPSVRISLPENTTATSVEKHGWRLVFGDEFDDTQIDENKWQTQYWWGRTNPPDIQYYAPDAFDFKDGRLRIRAEKREMGGYAYTSGLISSRESFSMTYGYVEARVRVPSGKGLWPAIWLASISHQSSSEIDVMEILGQEARRVYLALHYDDTQGKPQGYGLNFAGPDFSHDFHTFAVDWSPTAVICYVDGIERFRVTQNVPEEPMYLIANLAAGSVWSGYPDATTAFPAYFDIDYIRVYQR